jgi:hypothetical protein
MARRFSTLLSVAFFVLALACAATTPATSWQSSVWYSKSMAGSSGGFDEAQSACLDQGGVTDPAAVEPGSSAETDFIACMNTRQWCSNAYHCNRSGV